MKGIVLTTSVVVALVFALTFMGAQEVYATPVAGSLQIKLSDSFGNTVIITDGGGCVGTACGTFTGDLNVAAAGVVTAAGTIGGWTVNVTTGLGYTFNSQGTLDLNSINATSAAGGGTLTVQVTQVGFDVDYPGFSLAAGATLTGSGASVLYTASGGNSNLPFDTTSTIATLGPFAPSAFSGTTSGPGNVVNPYSLTLTTVITASASGPTSYSGGSEHLSPVPEPASLALLGSGLIGLGLLSFLRSRRSPVQRSSRA